MSAASYTATAQCFDCGELVIDSPYCPNCGSENQETFR